MQEIIYKIAVTPDTEVALWNVFSEENNKHVLLTHGAFSNKKVLNGIIKFLVSKGYTCWIFEWRNHGESPKSTEKFQLEHIADDFKVIFNYLSEVHQIEKLHCITHSGGGICLTMALINYPKLQQKIISFTMFACQAFGACVSTSNRLKMLIGKQASRLLGKIPKTFVGGIEDENYHFMEQWFDWNLKREFKGTSGIEYQSKMKKVLVPVFSIFGSGDKFIAPVKGCQEYFSEFQHPHNKSLLASKNNGFIENYSHSRILHSSSAKKEIYPKVLDFLKVNEL